MVILLHAASRVEKVQQVELLCRNVIKELIIYFNNFWYQSSERIPKLNAIGFRGIVCKQRKLHLAQIFASASGRLGQVQKKFC
jgi:hypothetical protein